MQSEFHSLSGDRRDAHSLLPGGVLVERDELYTRHLALGDAAGLLCRIHTHN